MVQQLAGGHGEVIVLPGENHGLTNSTEFLLEHLLSWIDAAFEAPCRTGEFGDAPAARYGGLFGRNSTYSVAGTTWARNRANRSDCVRRVGEWTAQCRCRA